MRYEYQIEYTYDRYNGETNDVGYVRELVAHAMREKADFSVRRYGDSGAYSVVATGWTKATGEYVSDCDPAYMARE